MSKHNGKQGKKDISQLSQKELVFRSFFYGILVYVLSIILYFGLVNLGMDSGQNLFVLILFGLSGTLLLILSFLAFLGITNPVRVFFKIVDRFPI